MPRNPDSSRFGKLYQIYFNKQNRKLTACALTPYMLEKSRVSAQQMNERNFHLFYRMLCDPVDIMQTDGVDGNAEMAQEILEESCTVPAGEDLAGKPTWWEEGGKKLVGLHPDLRAMCKLGRFEDYVYLNGGSKMLAVNYQRIYGDIPKDWVAVSDGTVETICPEGPRKYHDAENMSEMMVSLLGFFTEEQVHMILKTAAGVLHLGNVDILGDADECKGVDKTGTSLESLQNVAELWQVS